MGTYHVPGTELGSWAQRMEKSQSSGRKTGKQIGRALLKDRVSQQWSSVGIHWMRDTKAHDGMGLLEQRSSRGHGDFAKNESYFPFQVIHAAREPPESLAFYEEF